MTFFIEVEKKFENNKELLTRVGVISLSEKSLFVRIMTFENNLSVDTIRVNR